MQEPTLLVLTALAEGPQHGYGLLARVQEVSQGRVRLRVGTMYAALERLAGEGLVEVAAEEIVDSRLRRTYRLTDAGVGALRAEVERLAGLVTVARVGLSRLPGHGVPALRASTS